MRAVPITAERFGDRILRRCETPGLTRIPAGPIATNRPARPPAEARAARAESEAARDRYVAVLAIRAAQIVGAPGWAKSVSATSWPPRSNESPPPKLPPAPMAPDSTGCHAERDQPRRGH